MRIASCMVALSLLLMMSMAEIEDLPLYKDCLMECFRCVKIYGKHIYNGKLCAENCALTNGASIDMTCYPPVKRANNKTQLATQCIKTCQHCQSENPSCVLVCILSNFKVDGC